MMHQSLVHIVCCLFLQYVLISADPLASEFKGLREDENEFLSGKNFTVLPLSLPIPKFLDQNLSESTPFPSQTHPVVVADAKNTKTATRPGSSQKNRRRKGKRNKNGKRIKSNRASNNPRKNSQDFEESKDLEDQKEILRSTMRYMFGFDHMLTTPEMVKQKVVAENVGDKSDEQSSGEATKLKGQNGKEDEKLEALDLPEPPDFMLELYETYSKDNNLMMLHSRSQGDTIRSFFPSPADPRFREKDRGRPVIIVPVVERDGGPKGALGREVRNGFQPDNRMPAFLFNLSSIPSEEELVSVEIRLDGRAKNYRSNFPSFQQDGGLGNDEANNTHPSSWNLKIGVYKIGRISCRDEIDCSADDISKIFIKVGRTVVISSPAITTWSDKELVLLARKARKLDHVMLVKFTRDPSAPNNTEELSRSSRHIKKPSENGNEQHHTSKDLPNTFTVPESERPKRNSDRTKSLASAQPFLSEPSQFGKDFNALDLLDSEFDITQVPMLIIYSNDSRTVEATEAPQISPLIWGALENVTASLTRRTRRSIDNISEMEENQLPEAAGVDDTREYDPNIMQTESDKRRRPFVVKKGKAQNRQTKRINNSLSNDQTELHDNEKSRRLLMDTLKDKRRRRKNKKCEDRKGRRRKGCRKGKKGKGKNIPPHESLEALNRAHLLCGRRSLHVDFADIGWSDWIISPNYFDAYYCSGRCEIPHMQSMQGTSNHAIIQALIKAIGVNKEIPAPCCVPEKLMSLSVLYYDEEKNVVLKVYRNMSVETCSCR